jgi:hypothetical protein
VHSKHYEVRLDTAFRDPGIMAHHWLLKKRDVDGVSSDESDGELPCDHEAQLRATKHSTLQLKSSTGGKCA